MADKRNYSRLKLLAEELYIANGLNLTEISARLDVAPNTLTKWKRDGDWETTRDYYQNAPHRIEKKLNKLMEEILDTNIDAIEQSFKQHPEETDQEFVDRKSFEIIALKQKIQFKVVQADAVSKIKPALALLRKDINPSVVYSVLTKLDNFASVNYPDMAFRSLDLHKAFLQHMVSEHG